MLALIRMQKQFLNTVQRALCLVACCAGQISCAFWSPKDVDPVLPAVHTTLEMGEVKENVEPLPQLTPYFRKEIQGNKVLSRRLAYRAWDFNRDGRFDMLEVISPSGKVTKRVFDFNFDGVVDQLEQLEKIDKKSKVPATVDETN